MSLKAQVYLDLTFAERRLLREKYVEDQKGLCWYCKASLLEKSPYEIKKKKVNWWRFPKNFLLHPIHLHHDHDTGLTIGAVHAYCNAVSFDYEESPISRNSKRGGA
jgi:hypothetical protein